jgi:hypothetical protein
MSISIKIMKSKMSTPIIVPTERHEVLALLRQARQDRRDVFIQGIRLRKSIQQEKIKALQMASPEKRPEKVEKVMWDAVTSHRRRNHISRVIVRCIYVVVKVVMVVP